MNIFDKWNIIKKKTSKKPRRYFKEREIWWCSLGINIGDEESGKGIKFERPVLVIIKFNRNVGLIAPLTTSTKNNRYYFNLGSVNNKKAQVIISQLRLIDSKRLTNRIGIIDKELFSKIKKTVRNLF